MINYVILVVTYYAVRELYDLKWQKILGDCNSVLFHIIQGRIRGMCVGERQVDSYKVPVNELMRQNGLRKQIEMILQRNFKYKK